MPAMTYLFFNGNCAEALKFYERVFNARLDGVMTYGDSPEGACPPNVTPDKIMHARLVLPDGGVILASDDMSGQYRGMSGFAVVVSNQDAAETKRVYDQLVDGGQVWMPLGKTFFSDAFAMLADKYGTPWMVITYRDE